MIRYGLGIGCDIKDFSRADASEPARGDVSNGIGAGFACRQANFCQFPHDGADLRQRHEVQLKVLPSCHVTNASRIDVTPLSKLNLYIHTSMKI